MTAIYQWTIERVAKRLEEASRTSFRLPPVRVQGYFNSWPAIPRQRWEAYAAEAKRHRSLPPSPATIDRMLETMRWMHWLDVDQRHLVWSRARRVPWRAICAELDCDRSTAWRRWKHVLHILVGHLNAKSITLQNASSTNLSTLSGHCPCFAMIGSERAFAAATHSENSVYSAFTLTQIAITNRTTSYLDSDT